MLWLTGAFQCFEAYLPPPPLVWLDTQHKRDKHAVPVMIEVVREFFLQGMPKDGVTEKQVELQWKALIEFFKAGGVVPLLANISNPTLMVYYPPSPLLPMATIKALSPTRLMPCFACTEQTM